MAVYIRSPIRLHCILLNQLSKGTTLLFTFSIVVLKLFTSEPAPGKRKYSQPPFPPPPVSFYHNRSHGMSDVLFSLFCVFLHTI
jgi:hypothetical protein